MQGIVDLLGGTVPAVSLYFLNLVIVKVPSFSSYSLLFYLVQLYLPFITPLLLFYYSRLTSLFTCFNLIVFFIILSHHFSTASLHRFPSPLPFTADAYTVVQVFAAVPIEMCRPWQVSILSVYLESYLLIFFLLRSLPYSLFISLLTLLSLCAYVFSLHSPPHHTQSSLTPFLHLFLHLFLSYLFTPSS